MPPAASVGHDSRSSGIAQASGPAQASGTAQTSGIVEVAPMGVYDRRGVAATALTAHRGRRTLHAVDPRPTIRLGERAYMGAGDISEAAFERAGGVLVRALTGLSIEQLRKQPAGPESNPIGWLAWHLSRVHDNNFSTLLAEEQVWVSEGWCDRFRLSPETGSGSRSTLDEVRAFDPIGSELLIGYWGAVRAQSHRFLERLRDEELDTPTKHPASYAGPSGETFKLTIARTTGDTIQHIGQVAYARGLVDRHGWYGA